MGEYSFVLETFFNFPRHSPPPSPTPLDHSWREVLRWRLRLVSVGMGDGGVQIPQGWERKKERSYGRGGWDALVAVAQ